MKEKTLKFWLYFIVCAAALLLIGLFVLVVFQIVQIKSLSREKAKSQATLNDLVESEAYYDSANSYVQTDEFIEDYAREVLELGKDGEENYN